MAIIWATEARTPRVPATSGSEGRRSQAIASESDRNRRALVSQAHWLTLCRPLMTDVTPKPVLTDARIQALLREPKRLPPGWIVALRLDPAERGHASAELEVTGEEGTAFEIRLRQSSRDPLNFSAILFALDVDGVRRFRLRRYNGRNHGHRNLVERKVFGPGFHIHHATERYQRAGCDEDGFAELTGRYSSLNGALECLIEDCNFQDDDPQLRLI